MIENVKQILNLDTLLTKGLKLASSSKSFISTYRFLEKSQFWSQEQFEEYQLKKTKNLLFFCNENVPFYRKRWAELKININSVKELSDLSEIPLTTKEDLKKYSNEMVPITFNKDKLILTRTGGTTGAPANFYETKNTESIELAFFVMYWKWHDCNFFVDKMAFFRGSYEKRENIKKIGNKYFLPTWNLSESKLMDYIKYINENKISFIHGYPSLIYQLFKTAADHELPLETLKAAFFASEKSYLYQKEFIQTEFNIPVYSHYGHQERTALFMQCQFNDAYHIIPQYGYTEFKPVDNSNLHEIISTGFINLATPLIRYDTEDYVNLINGTDCCCNHKFPKIVEDIAGRTGDIIITPSGKLIQPNHLEYAIRYISHFKDCQIIQDEVDHLKVLIVPDDQFILEEAENFKKAILWRIDENMKIDIELKDNIERPINFKKRFTINTSVNSTVIK